MVSVFVARQSGQSTSSNLNRAVQSRRIDLAIKDHESHGRHACSTMMIVFTVIAIVAWVLSRDPARFKGAVAIGDRRR